MVTTTEYLGLRVIPETKRKLEENAEKRGFINTSEYLRDLIRKELEREV